MELRSRLASGAAVAVLAAALPTGALPLAALPAASATPAEAGSGHRALAPTLLALDTPVVIIDRPWSVPAVGVRWLVASAARPLTYDVAYAQVLSAPGAPLSYGPEQAWLTGTAAVSATLPAAWGTTWEVRVRVHAPGFADSPVGRATIALPAGPQWGTPRVSAGSLAQAMWPETDVQWAIDGAPADCVFDVTFAKLTDVGGVRTAGPEQRWLTGTTATRGHFSAGWNVAYEVRVVARDRAGSTSPAGVVVLDFATRVGDLVVQGASVSSGWYQVPHGRYVGGTALVTYRGGATWSRSLTLDAGVRPVLGFYGTTLPDGAKADVYVDGRLAGTLDSSSVRTGGVATYNASLGAVPWPADQRAHTVLLVARMSPGRTTLALDAYLPGDLGAPTA